jgi:hypothetical chaperone protein
MVRRIGCGAMRQPIAYGIDFGTSNSSIAVSYRRDEAPLDELTDPGVPSLLYLDAVGLELVGDTAAQQYLLGRDPTQSRLMSSLKTFLADDLFTRTTSWGKMWSLEDLTKFILRDLKRQADERLNADVKRVLIGYPVVFIGAEGDRFETLQALALERLEEAARLAGFKEVEFLDEPTAALYHDDLASGINVALDFGAGTFDISIVQYRSQPRRATEVLAINGLAVGGDRFDSAVFKLALHKRLGFDDLRYADPIEDACTTAGMLHLVRDANALHRLADYVHKKPRSGLRILQRIMENGQAYSLSKAVEKAKIKLSTTTTTTVELFRPDAGFNIQEEICRDDFDMLISDDLNQVFEVIDRTLRDAEIAPRDVDQVILTGGSCKIPAFRQRVRSKFRSSRISDASVASRVALGLAQEARRLWS